MCMHYSQQFFLLIHFDHFFRWDILVIYTTVILKLPVMLFISPWFWAKWLNFFWSFKTNSVYDRKMTQKIRFASNNLTEVVRTQMLSLPDRVLHIFVVCTCQQLVWHVCPTITSNRSSCHLCLTQWLVLFHF